LPAAFLPNVLDEQLVDVAVGRELHELRGEWDHQKDVNAEFLDELGAAGQRGQLRRVTAGVHHFHRVRIERHEHGRHTARPPHLDRGRDQLLMSAVHAVEHTDRQDTSAPVGGYLVLAAPALHSGKPTAATGACMKSRGSTAARREIHDLDVKCIDFEA